MFFFKSFCAVLVGLDRFLGLVCFMCALSAAAVRCNRLRYPQATATLILMRLASKAASVKSGADYAKYWQAPHSVQGKLVHNGPSPF